CCFDEDVVGKKNRSHVLLQRFMASGSARVDGPRRRWFVKTPPRGSEPARDSPSARRGEPTLTARQRGETERSDRRIPPGSVLDDAEAGGGARLLGGSVADLEREITVESPDR